MSVGDVKGMYKNTEVSDGWLIMQGGRSIMHNQPTLTQNASDKLLGSEIINRMV